MGQLNTSAIQKRADPDKDGIGSFATHRFECGIDLGAGISVEDLDLQPQGASSRVHILQLSLGYRCVSRIDEYCNTDELGQQPTQELQPLRGQLSTENI